MENIGGGGADGGAASVVIARATIAATVDARRDCS
jgi:hypothetical protein